MADISQTFLLIATFNIALISVTIANYAVSASYLGRETRLTRSRMEKRKQELMVRFKEMQEDNRLDTLEQEIKKAKRDISKLSRRIFILSWFGAVISPSSLFILSLITAILGMNIEILTTSLLTQNIWEQQFMMFSTGTLALGFFLLLVVIGVIDSAARKIPVPEFEVFFGNKSKTVKLKRKVHL